METKTLSKAPVQRTGMLIRMPAGAVFEAFIDPAVTTKFWFTHGSAKLEAGKHVQWEWEMYDFSISVTVKTVEPQKRIVFEWPGDVGFNTVEISFEHFEGATTFVRVEESGFHHGSGDEVLDQVAASSQGFALVLAGAKAYLEHGIRLNLVADRFPKGRGRT